MRNRVVVEESEIIASWLRGEIGSERYVEHVRAVLGDRPEALITAPNMNDDADNDARRQVLREWRGWGDNIGWLEGLPYDLSWERSTLDHEELRSVRYINRESGALGWTTWSNGKRLPSALIEYRTEYSLNVPDEDWFAFDAIAAAIECGERHEPIIVVGLPGGTDLVVLEGHRRLTGMVMAVDALPEQIEVFFGSSPTIDEWICYG